MRRLRHGLWWVGWRGGHALVKVGRLVRALFSGFPWLLYFVFAAGAYAGGNSSAGNTWRSLAWCAVGVLLIAFIALRHNRAIAKAWAAAVRAPLFLDINIPRRQDRG